MGFLDSILNSPEPPQVTVAAGELKGRSKGKGEFAVFRNIPYAAPPVGDNRWRPPQPVEPWSGVRDATKNGPTAHQRISTFETFVDALIEGQGWHSARVAALKTLAHRAPRPKESEDCLHLTVRTPNLDPQAGLPVMVWIHGGDHTDGASTDPFYESNALAANGVVTVAINYRLGVLGFLAHPELAAESEHGVSGNYGTLDQIAALTWVRDNIASFGGDPANVTIFGESAGGESVMHMMTSPLARGLFHRAISQSPANSTQMLHLRRPFLNYQAAEDNGVAFADGIGIVGTDQLARLREIPADQLVAVCREATRLGDHYPAIDGHVLPESPLAAFAARRQAQVPLIIGSNADEGSCILPAVGCAMAEYRHLATPAGSMQPEMVDAFGNDVDDLVRLYPGLERRDPKAEADFLGDHMFGGRAYWYARHHASAGLATWLYLFSRTPPAAGQTIGAYHAAEVPFVHGVGTPITPLTDPDKALAAKMRNYWTTLARAGDPNSATDLAWPQLDPAAPEWMNFNHDLVVEPVSRADKYAILNARTARLVTAMADLSGLPASRT